MNDSFPDPVPIDIDGTLDLHHFSPKDLKYLIPDYIDECLAKKIFEVRIIHGKGTGTLRRSVHAILAKIHCVKNYKTADEIKGGWGATIVDLKKPAR